MTDFYKEAVKKLLDANYVYSGPAKGSHEKWRHRNTGAVVTVPANSKSRHTYNGVLKQVGIKEKV